MSDDPLLCREMTDDEASREFAVRIVDYHGLLWTQQLMRDADGNLVWVYLKHVDGDPGGPLIRDTPNFQSSIPAGPKRRWWRWPYACLAILLLGAADLPDPNLTPGLVRTDLTLAQICGRRWGRDQRHVDAAMRRQVFQSYHISCGRYCASEFELDHLVPRELGGADDVRNLWPQSYAGAWNAHTKDQLENRLHAEVCTGRVPLATAQRMIASDWIMTWRRYVGE